VDARVRLVGVLVGHDELRIARDEVAGQRDRAVGAQRARRVDDLRAVERDELTPLERDVVGHYDRDAVALAPPDHGQGDAGVARRRLEQDRTGVQPAG